MRKYLVISTIFLLAAGCSKTQPSVQTAPVSQNQPAQNQQANPSPVSATTITQKLAASTTPLTLNVYNNAAEHFKVLYLSYFNLYTSANIKLGSPKSVNFSACVPYGIMPSWCFVLNSQSYANTNLESAGVAVSILKDKTNIADCGIFTAQELNGGQVEGSVQGNGVVFVTAKATDAGAGNFSEIHFNRAFYGTICYEIDETAHWTGAGNYSPPRVEFDRTDVWAKLDILRNGFGFVK
jgi:uncharacterized protein YcfL